MTEMTTTLKANGLLNKFQDATATYAQSRTPENESAMLRARKNVADYFAELEAALCDTTDTLNGFYDAVHTEYIMDVIIYDDALKLANALVEGMAWTQ